MGTASDLTRMVSCLQIPRSFLIMPKNQVTDTVRKLAREFGVRSIRVAPQCWLYDPARVGRMTRLLRYLDSFLPIVEFLLPKRPREGELEGRFFFRPANKFVWLDRVHFWRLRLGFHIARMTGRDFHLWSHPHNFGGDVPRAIQNLRRVMKWLAAQESTNFARMDYPVDTDGTARIRKEKQAI